MSADNAAVQRIGVLRGRVEAIDASIIRLIAQRVALAREIGREKAAAGLPTLDPAREVEIVSRIMVEAKEAQLDAETVRDIAWRIIGLSRRAQQDQRQPIS
ncbi:MAG: chorismate mutase [Longimicrobiales bacterium]